MFLKKNLFFLLLITSIFTANLFSPSFSSEKPFFTLVSLPDLMSQNYLEDPELNEILIQGMEKGIKGDYEGAIADFTTVISRDSSAGEAYYNRGIAYEKSQQYELAIADFNQALMLDSEAAHIYVERAKVAHKLGNHEIATTDLETAITLFETQGNTYHYQETQKLLRELQTIK